MEQKEYRFFAFISYKSDDLKEAWGLKKRLDSYRLPTVLCKKYKKDKKPTYEAFLDKTNIQIGELREELKKDLDNSRYLIVICSPRSAKIGYVTDEINWFTRNGRENQMYLFIIESDPKNISESFNPAIIEAQKRWSERDGIKREFLGANINEKDVDKISFLYRWPIIGSILKRERAYMQLISKLLNLNFEQLWSYQKIRLAEKIISWIIGVIMVLSALTYTWWINQPVDIAVQLNEATVQNPQLPPLKDAVVNITFDNKTETDTIHTLDSNGSFVYVPHKFLGKEVQIKVSCQNYMDLDTSLVLTKVLLLNISRNPAVFGNIHFRLWDPYAEVFVTDTQVEIAGYKTTSNQEGLVELFIPLEQQQPFYHIETTIPLNNDKIVMPCGTDAVVTLKRPQ